MKPAHLYWALIALLAFLHLQALTAEFAWQMPVHFTILLVLAGVFFLARRYLLNLSVLGIKGNSLLFLLQALLVLDHPSSLSFFLFAGIEIIRHIFARKLFTYGERIQYLEEQSEHVNETFRIVRGERHDFLKHISALHFLLENGKNTEARTYLEGLVDGYEETNLSIKGEKGVVAGILNQMYRRAKSAGISVVYDLDLPLSTLPLSDHDLVTLLGNMLANSIEACEEWQQKQQKQGHVTLQFYKRGGLYLLSCVNSSPIIPAEILDELYETYGKTTKAGEHQGLGTKMIRDTVKAHQGFLDFKYKEEEFSLKIKIPAIQ